MIRGGTHSSASPKRLARFASTVRPVNIMSSAAGAPAQHDFRQPQACAGLVDDDAVAARERELEPTAQTEAADERDRRILDGREPLERVPAAAHDRHRGSLVLDDFELLDVGTGNETARLARRDDKPGGRVAVEKVERFVEFHEHFGAQRVGRCAFLVER
jgi:hypothetical protein